ncbi:hypothetical protein [Asanoa iriomotensis]|uniref:Uncharacterized protein n=1 Tax=Asanoa iriomotensis TaxID=234613 RepID=A0ABQ4BUP4_9ACTN|nr:hypothetical protein [Asanoa iriomotensis]GIF54238.1 hypothetical protein Air01nite_03330 [Asanoa iriomotensis]
MNILPEPAPSAQQTRQRLAHPSWCIRTDCAENGEHVSRWHSVNPDRPQLVEIDLRLSRGIVRPAPTWIELAARVGSDRHVYELSRAQTAALKHVLGALLAEIRA